jgi:sugar phosphate isomerase/epimerase
LLAKHSLKLAAVGSGAGWARHKLRLTDAEAQTRLRAREFVASIVDLAGGFGAPAIVGSMQGRWEGNGTRERALGWLAEALEELAPRAERHGVPLLFEPLNRYESNVLSNVADSLAFLKSLRTQNVKLLCDLFHMNIEEADIAGSLRLAGAKLGHVHFVDSNRLAVGLGHTDIAPIAAALKEIGYAGYISAEALPLPDSDAAAKQTFAGFRRWFGNSAS